MSAEKENNRHKPVMLKEVINLLQPKKGQCFIDLTLGEGGHSQVLAEKIGQAGLLLAIDRDQEALVRSKKKLALALPEIRFRQANFAEVEEIVKQEQLKQINGILMDLGTCSSTQLACPERGFSFQQEGPLDMRYNHSAGLTAYEIINFWSEEELISILKNYGEERKARTIAKAIINYRKTKTIDTTTELRQIIETVFGYNREKRSRTTAIHVATRTFQALRIAVNNELENLSQGLEGAINVLSPKGRLAVITYHSLEDRIVKQFMRKYSGYCTCPPKLPVCKCQSKKTLSIITRRPITPSTEEIKINAKSRSAKLRVAEKIEPEAFN